MRFLFSPERKNKEGGEHEKIKHSRFTSASSRFSINAGSVSKHNIRRSPTRLNYKSERSLFNNEKIKELEKLVSKRFANIVRSQRANRNNVFSRKVIRWIKENDHDAWICYRYPATCTHNNVNPSEIDFAVSKMRQLYTIADKIRAIAYKFKTQTENENPALTLSNYYKAYANTIFNVYKFNPLKMAEMANKIIPDAEMAYSVLENAIKNEAFEWSKEYCNKQYNCLTASKPVKNNNTCIQYLVIEGAPEYLRNILAKKGIAPFELSMTAIIQFKKKC